MKFFSYLYSHSPRWFLVSFISAVSVYSIVFLSLAEGEKIYPALQRSGRAWVVFSFMALVFGLLAVVRMARSQSKNKRG